MGHKRQLLKKREHNLKNRRESREKRSLEARSVRRGEDVKKRRLERVVIASKIPTLEQSRLLITQFSQACRVPSASHALCALIRSVGKNDENEINDRFIHSTISPQEGASGKTALHQLDQIINQVLSLRTFSAEEKTLFIDETATEKLPEPVPIELSLLDRVIKDEYGSRVLYNLLKTMISLKHPKTLEVCTELSQVFISDPSHLSGKYSSRIASELVEADDGSLLKSFIGVLSSSLGENIDIALMDRHLGKLIHRFMMINKDVTGHWLEESLLPGGSTGTKNRLSKTHSSKQSKKASSTSVATSDSITHLQRLIEDPVAFSTLQLWTEQEHIRTSLWSMVSVSQLIKSKRGTRFLIGLLVPPSQNSLDDTDNNQIHIIAQGLKFSSSLFTSSLSELNFRDLCLDKERNFLVQKIAKFLVGLTACRASPGGDLFLPNAAESSDVADKVTKDMNLLLEVIGDETLKFLVTHPIGVHVAMVITRESAKIVEYFPSAMGWFESVLIKRLASLEEMTDLVYHKHGSLWIRLVLSLATKGGIWDSPDTQASVLAKSPLLCGFRKALESQLESMIYDNVGNLVLQVFLRTSPEQGRRKFYDQFIKDNNLKKLCQHPSASHVMHTLLILADTAMQQNLCSMIRPFVPTLATHINGRFIVEELIHLNQSVRDVLTRDFCRLASEQGTQHILVKLFKCLDAKTKKQLINEAIIPNIKALSVHPKSSVVLQKLLQEDVSIGEALHNYFYNVDVALRQEVMQSFHGMFVIRNISSLA